jgi:NADH-quinone oxidoreductase E subunit|tara:strand:- start:1696 stop:2301 length:606 start_codon:yes stop_codon:yes gene_type:complete
MSLKKVYDKQPESFEFTKDNLDLAKRILEKYPKGKEKSAVMPLLYLAQSQNNNWIPLAALKYIGNYLSMPYVNVYEIATFYSMYNLAPVGKYFLQICTTSPCLLRGANEIVKVCQSKISKDKDTISNNGLCSWTEVECLGACVNAPVMQVNNDYYEDLDKINTEKILNSFIEDKPLKPGSYRGRKNTAPEKKQNNNGANNA